jgi:hypothetical protein
MNHRLLMSAAIAALMAGTGFASAQGTMNREAPSTTQNSPSTERSSPGATQMNRGSGSEMKSNETERMQRAGESDQRAQDNKMQPNKKSAQENLKGDKSKSMSSESNSARDSNKMKAEGRNGTLSTDSKNAESKSQTTTGQAGAGAKLSTEQRTKITTVIREQKVQPVTNVNFSISVGTRVPRTVHFHPLPTEIITVYPAWRGYEFFLVREEIVVVNPRTMEIVAVLEA